MVSLLVIHRQKHPTYHRADEISNFLCRSNLFSDVACLSPKPGVVTDEGRLPLMWFKDILQFKNLHKKMFDVCWTDELSIAAFAKELRLLKLARKFVYDDPDYFPSLYSGWLKHLVEIMEARAARGADLVISISHELARMRIEQGANMVKIIPNGINYELLNKAYWLRTNRTYRVDFKPEKLIYIGSFELLGLTPYVLAEVFKKRPDAILILAGYGKLPKEFHKLGIMRNVKFLGTVPHNNLGDILASADVGLALLTSPAFNYGVPLKMVEYIAAGLPVITTAFKPLAKFVSENNVGMSVSNDVKKMAEAVLSLLNLSRNEYVELSHRAMKCAEIYDWQSLLRRYTRYIIECAEDD